MRDSDDDDEEQEEGWEKTEPTFSVRRKRRDEMLRNVKGRRASINISSLHS